MVNLCLKLFESFRLAFSFVHMVKSMLSFWLVLCGKSNKQLKLTSQPALHFRAEFSLRSILARKFAPVTSQLNWALDFYSALINVCTRL